MTIFGIEDVFLLPYFDSYILFHQDICQQSLKTEDNKYNLWYYIK